MFWLWEFSSVSYETMVKLADALKALDEHLWAMHLDRSKKSLAKVSTALDEVRKSIIKEIPESHATRQG